MILPDAALCRRMLCHALEDPGREACGLVGASDGRPSSYYPVANAADRPERSFLMESAGQLQAMRTMRGSGETMAGIFHSHPDGSAEPSATDLALAAYPDVTYYIAALRDDGAELHAWFFDGRRFRRLGRL